MSDVLIDGLRAEIAALTSLLRRAHDCIGIHYQGEYTQIYKEIDEVLEAAKPVQHQEAIAIVRRIFGEEEKPALLSLLRRAHEALRFHEAEPSLRQEINKVLEDKYGN